MELATCFDHIPSDDFSAVAGPATVTLYVENCSKCGGSGSFGRVTRLGHSVCTQCGGAGKVEFKTSREYRVQQRAKAQQRKASKQADALLAWIKANPAERAWIDANCERFDFARSMAEAVEKYGSLTEGQLAAVRKCIARDAERASARKVEQAALNVRAEAVESAKLEQAFAKAKASGLKWPKIKLTGFAFKPAGDNSRNPGSIYVTDDSGLYLGKVAGGRFTPSRDCSDEVKGNVATVMADPLQAAKAHGLMTGNCCICSRELTDPESVALGIGPICAERFF